MTLDSVNMIINAGIMTIINCSLPCIGAGLLVGLLVAIVQAVTQIQEQTLTFVPKMITVFMVLSATFPWITGLMLDLCNTLWKNIPFYAR